MDIRIRAADPAGNITIFVLDHFERSDYAKVAVQLLGMKDIGAEQVAFVTGSDSMEMCGLEFCGNASRAFGLMCAEKTADQAGQRITVPVRVSGAEGVTLIETDTGSGFACIEMPGYKDMYPLSRISSIPHLPEGTVVDQGGIVHVVLEDTEASDDLFFTIRDLINEKTDPPAMGVMFCKGDHVMPVVYVRDVDSVYHEGSCCSGTTAVVTARSAGRPDGQYEYEIIQPAGILTGIAELKDGQIMSVRIGGTVKLYPERTVRISI